MEIMVVDPITISIFTSLIANGFTALASFSVAKVKEVRKRGKILQDELRKDEKLITTIREVIERIFESDEFTSNKLEITMIQLFLQSPTVENIVRQIFSDYIIDDDKNKSITQLKEEFRICLAKHLGVKEENILKISNYLFEVISNGCRRALDLSIKENILSAHEAKDIARHRVIIDEIRAIKNNLDFLKTQSSLDVDIVKEFEKHYRAQVGNRTRKIAIPHIDKSLRVDIKKIFVSPNFVSNQKKKEGMHELITLDDFVNSIYRTVLLGDPGGGKSTFAQKLCHELCGNYVGRLVGNRLLTPILVVLRDYSVKKREDNFSIIQFIEHEVTSKYQFPKEPPSGAFEYLLHNGHVLVIFDGLDELLIPSDRREVSKDIESFCNLFPSINVLVTSRVVGYEQAPLDTDVFTNFSMAPFNDNQVKDYAMKWFGQDTSFSPDERMEHPETFLEESQIVIDLRSNPLMLALMCNLYRGTGFIPRNRPEIYKKCSQMLFEHWDKSRGIRWTNLPVIEPQILLSNLAYWIFSNESLQSGVTEKEIIKRSTDVLCPSRFECKEEAESAAKEFIKFCKGRAWVFTDVGTTPDGKNLFKFTHKTFLEYFTAIYVVRNNSIPKKLWKFLKSKITYSSWNEIAQLSVQLIHEYVENASDDMLTLLINDSKKNEQASWNYLSFGAQCLEFIYPSPKIIRELTAASVKFVIENISSYEKGETTLSTFVKSRTAEDMIDSLFTVTSENRNTIASAVINEILNYAENKDDTVAYCAIDLGLHFDLAMIRHPRKFKKEAFDYWQKEEEKTFEKIKPILVNLAQVKVDALLNLIVRDEKYMENIFECYNPDNLFLEPRSSIFKTIIQPSIAITTIYNTPLFDTLVDKDRAKWLVKSIKFASELGKILVNSKLPCFSSDIIEKLTQRPLNFILIPPDDLDSVDSNKNNLVKIKIPADSFFGVWCIFATYIESIATLGGKNERMNEILSNLEKFENKPMVAILNLIKARFDLIDTDNILKSHKEFNLSIKAQKVIEQWINNKLSFIQLPAVKRKITA